MKRSRFSEGQIIKILKETEITGKTVADVCREQGIAQSTYTNGNLNMAVWMRASCVSSKNWKRKIANSNRCMPIYLWIT